MEVTKSMVNTQLKLHSVTAIYSPSPSFILNLLSFRFSIQNWSSNSHQANVFQGLHSLNHLDSWNALIHLDFSSLIVIVIGGLSNCHATLLYSIFQMDVVHAGLSNWIKIGSLCLTFTGFSYSQHRFILLSTSTFSFKAVASTTKS